MIMLPLPGTTWNGTTALEIKDIAPGEAKELVIDLLTGKQKWFSKSHSGERFDNREAESIFDNFIGCLSANSNKELSFFRITPDFLWKTDDSFAPDNDYTRLGYFENSGRDLARAILAYERETDTMELNLLLTNGYG